jgi:enoyl-CoA hydratase
VVITGSGDKSFCAGADLKAMSSSQQDADYSRRFREEPDLAWRALLRHYHLKKPLVAAVEGYAVAGGTEILQATDIRVAGEGATFGIYEAKRGLFPLGGSTVRLVRQIPYARAMDILLTARPVSAAEALEIGLVSRVVPDGTALTEGLAIAAAIAANGPLSVQGIKRSVRSTEALPEDEALKIELEIGSEVFMSDDAKEGPRAFAEKRPPNFQGR